MKYEKGDLIRYNVRTGPAQICVVLDFILKDGIREYCTLLDLNDGEIKEYYLPFVEDPQCWIRIS
jgi:hypothetical protein